jgi:hypothetical protein
MKRALAGSIAIVAIAMFVLCTPSFAAEFSAEVIHTGAGSTFKSKAYVKGENQRQEIAQQGRKTVMIIRMDKRTVWSLMPDEKMYMEMPMTANNGALPGTGKDIETKAEKKDLGRETVNGFDCKKVQYIFRDKSKGTVTQWFSEKLGYPIKTESEGTGGHMIIEYQDIKEEKLPDSLFEVPAGYQKMSMPMMPGGMNMPKR